MPFLKHSYNRGIKFHMSTNFIKTSNNQIQQTLFSYHQIKISIMSTVILDFPPFYDHRIHSVYKMKGCNYTIIRRKGGPTETMIKESRKFREVRNNNGNFGAAAKAAGMIKNAIKPVKHLTNISNFGQLTSLCLSILKMDLLMNPARGLCCFPNMPAYLQA